MNLYLVGTLIGLAVRTVSLLAFGLALDAWSFWTGGSRTGEVHQWMG